MSLSFRSLLARQRSAPATKPAVRRAKFGLESLESREVPTVASLTNGVLSITGSEGNDLIELRATNANSVTVLEHGSVVADFPFAAPVIKGINLDGRGGIDQLVVRSLPALLNGGQLSVSSVEAMFIGKDTGAGMFTTAEVRSPVAITSPTNFLNIANDAAVDSQFVTLTAHSVTGLTPKPVTFTMDSEPTLILQTGKANDTINVNSTPVGLSGKLTLTTNDGSDTVNVATADTNIQFNGRAGDDTLTVAQLGGSLDPINGRIDFDGGTGTDFVSMNDRNEVGIISNPAGVFNLYNAFVFADHITRNVDSLQPGLPFHESATVGYTGVEGVTLSASDRPMANVSHVHVFGTSVPTLINAGAEDVLVSNNGKLDDIRGALTVNRATAGGKLILDDSAQPCSTRYTLGAGCVTELGQPVLTSAAVSGPGGPILFPLKLSISFNDNVQTVQLKAGTVGDNIDVSAPRTGTGQYVVDGGGGLDTLTGPNQDNSFGVTGANVGILDGSVNFSNVESLVGSAKDDHIFFTLNGSLDGFVNGGGGTFDTLDYSFTSTAVTVNLATGAASRVGGGSLGRVTNIENVYGGSGSDLLIGNAANNVLMGNDGNDSIFGGGGTDLLIGGNGADTLSDQNGTAIYIGGRVEGDLAQFTEAGRKAVMAEWTRTDLPGTAAQQYTTKVAHLKNGGGLNGSVTLSSATLSADGAVDTLHPNSSAGAIDLFVIDVRDVFQGINTPSAIETQNRIVV